MKHSSAPAICDRKVTHHKADSNFEIDFLLLFESGLSESWQVTSPRVLKFAAYRIHNLRQSGARRARVGGDMLALRHSD
jgi:hypothetical protein